MPIEITTPGSKSISNRYLILAALSDRHTTINNIAPCDDTDLMIKNLKTLGIPIEQTKNSVSIKGGQFQATDSPINLYTHNAGTTTRFLTALACLTTNTIHLDGDERMRQRPLAPLIDSLTKLGANIHHQSEHLPLTITPAPLQGTSITMPGDISSQYITAIMLIAPFLNKPTTIHIQNELYSKPYIDITIKNLQEFGINIENQNYQNFTIHPTTTPNTNLEITVESDASSASYIAAYAAIHPEKPILLKNIFKSSIQGDIKFLEYLEKMGCQISQSPEGTIVQGPQELKSLSEINMNTTPDLVMTFAALAMITPGTTKITNIKNLRIKETDRLAALEKEITKFQIKTKTGPDFIEVIGNPHLNKELEQKSIHINTYNDHRIPMCFGIFKDKTASLTFEDPTCVSKSYSSYWDDIARLTKT